MNIPVMLLLLLTAGVAQSAVPPITAVGGAKIPFLCAMVLYYSLTRERGLVALAALLAGLVQDTLGEVPLGYSSLCFMVIGLGLNRFRDIVFTESLMTGAFFGAIAAAVTAFALGLLLWKDGVAGAEVARNLYRAGGSALLGALFTPVVFGLSFRLDRLVGNVAAKRDVVGEESIGYTRA